MQSQESIQATEPTSTETYSASIAEHVGLILAGLILLVLLALLWHLQGPKELSTFLGSAASGWAQAIGSAVAIFASYKMGERTFKRQLIRDEIAQLESRKHAFEVMAEVFLNVQQIDGASRVIALAPDTVEEAKIMATDALRQLQSIPVLSVPLPSLVAHLNLCREDMISYIGYATSWEEKKDLAILIKWAKHSLPNMNPASSATRICISQSDELNKQILKLKQRFHG